MTSRILGVHAIVAERDGGRCQKCGVHVDSTAYGGSHHHRKPRGMGGVRKNRLDVPSNLVTLCGHGTAGCHGHIEHHRQQAIADGWLISKLSRDDPADVPFRSYWGWARIDDEGRFFLVGSAEAEGVAG